MTTVKALVIQTNGDPELKELGNDLLSLQTEVGGWVEVVEPAPDHELAGKWTAWLNEEGKLRNLPENPAASLLADLLGWSHGFDDVLVGTVVFLGPADENGDVTDVPLGLLEAAAYLYALVETGLESLVAPN